MSEINNSAVRREKTHEISADRLVFGGNNAGVDNDIHIDTENPNATIYYQKPVGFKEDIIIDEKVRSDSYALKDGNLWATLSTNSIDFLKPVDFNNQTITGFTGISLTATQVTSSNYSGQTLDHELDQLTSAQNTILARTQGLTVNKLMVSNGAGLLSTSSLAETDLFRFNQASNQYQGSGTNTVYSQTQSSDSSTALNYLQMRQGSGGNAKEMGLRMFGNEQALLFQDTIQLKDVGTGSYPGTNIGQIKGSGINLISGKTSAGPDPADACWRSASPAPSPRRAPSPTPRSRESSRWAASPARWAAAHSAGR